MVEISVQPECLHIGQSLKQNKANSYKWFTDEHFYVSMPSLIENSVQPFNIFYSANQSNMSDN